MTHDAVRPAGLGDRARFLDQRHRIVAAPLRCGDVGQPDQIQGDAGQPADLPPQPRRLLQMLPRRVQPSSAMIGDAEMAQVL
jgi:hypothetical protein